MTRIFAALLALGLLVGCGDDAGPDPALYGTWKHISNSGERLWGTVRFSQGGQFTMTGLKAYEGQKSVDYTGRYMFIGGGKLKLNVTGAHGGEYAGEMGYRISDDGSGERLSLSLPGSVAGGRRAIFER